MPTLLLIRQIEQYCSTQHLRGRHWRCLCRCFRHNARHSVVLHDAFFARRQKREEEGHPLSKISMAINDI